MANKFVNALFGDYSKKEVKKIQKTVDKINSLAEKYGEMDDKELSAQTQLLKDLQQAKHSMISFPMRLPFAVRQRTVL